jgi:hypothetical protein
MYIKVKYCEVNKESKLHHAFGTCNPNKSKYAKIAPTELVTLWKYGYKYCKNHSIIAYMI